VLRPADGLKNVTTIPAIMALAKRGLTLLQAKRAIEAMVEYGEVIVMVPTVEDAHVFATELGVAGVAVRRLASAPVDVKAIRNALGLSQAQFARRFGLDIDAVQNWEQGRCQPDRPAQALLRAIAAAPKEVAAAQEEEMA
jgi:DNA-binding XRE family transcriptional regulator